MAPQVNQNVLQTFLVNDLGIRKLDKNQAQKYDIDADKFKEVAQDDNFIEIDDILDDNDLYAQFATMYLEELEADNKASEEQEKEEQLKVKDKGENKA